MKTSFTKQSLFLLIAFCTSVFTSFAQNGPPSSYSFYAYNEPYTYLTGGTSLTSLAGQDDQCQTSVPIGFNFLYAGTNYTQLSVNTNGWISFNNYCYTHNNENYNINNLNNFGPCLLPFWEDIGSQYGTVSYATSGTAPNRVFTLEYTNSIWDYTGSSPAISFQVRLYEGGVIKYHYKQESGAVVISTSNGGTTIGIGASSTSWQVLNDFSANPTTTSTTYTATQYGIVVRPATGQVYQFGDFPCNAAPIPAVSNVTSKTATITWGAQMPSLNYEYALNTTATPPGSGTPTTALSYNATGLTPATQYYFHIRNQCNSTQKTVWITIPIRTNPACTAPSGFAATKLTVESATVTWNKLNHALGYEYAVNVDRLDPTTTTVLTTTTNNTFDINQLAEGTKYYVHIRALCPGGEYSDWSLDSFTTLIKCLPPTLKIDYINESRAVVYWDPVRTALEYEYEISQSPTPLGNGTEIKTTSFLAFPLKDNNVYYFHVRSKCIDQKTPTESEWTTTAFQTWPTSVGAAGRKDFAVTVSPNPVKDMLVIRVAGNAGDGTVVMTDMAGRIVRTAVLEGQTPAYLETSGLSAGIYFVKYADKDHTETIRITKQ